MSDLHIRYLRQFEADLKGIVTYISAELNNPAAAHALVDDVEKAILARRARATIFAPVRTLTPRTTPYFSIHVRNYVVYYIVKEHIMEVRRILYRSRNIEGLL